MKRIKTILTISLLLTAFIGNAQIKVHDNNHVSIGSLGKTYGIQVYPNGYITFANPNTNATIVTMTKVTTTAMRSWLVKRDDLAPVYRFYVNGYGDVYRNASYSISNPPTLINIVGPINNPTNALNQINGYYYTLIDEDKNDNKNDRLNVGLSAEEIGKVIPEAVVTTEEGDMYINYEVLTVFLIEAVKEQQQKIQELSRIIEKNGLLK